jgi:hypothetical protein
MRLGYLGIDQYGQTYTLNKHPRKELLEYLGKTTAKKMFVDTTSGDSRHLGYVIGNLWIRILEVHAWKEKEGEL